MIGISKRSRCWVESMEKHLRIDREDAARAYFETFLPGLRGELLLPGLRSLNCSLGVRVTDLQEAAWVLVIQSGRLEAVMAGIGHAQCAFCLDTGTLLEVATGALAPDKAFFDLRIEIEGDMALGLQLSTVLEPFFQLYPYHLTAL